MREITSLLRAASGGADPSFDRLMPLVYGELRRLARSHMRRMGAMTLMDTTGLVHEAYLRLQDAQGLDFPDRQRFLSYASRVMRALAVDAARRRLAAKRGAGLAFVTLATDAGLPASSADDLLRLDDALQALAQADERLARVVEMRYFGGLTEAEIGEALGITERTVQRDWRKARVYLLAAMQD
jgi:RNA polymerase sigma factor (TIGR02999 family)